MLVFLPVLSFKSVYGMKFDKKCNYEPVFSILSSWLVTAWLSASNPWPVSPCSAKCSLFSNHSAVKQEQIIFILNIIRRRQESGIGISFNDS